MADKKSKALPANVAIAQRIGTAIVTGEFPPNSFLLGEIELAIHHGVSRSVLRESLRMLSGKGLLHSRPKAGTRVRERSSWNLLDPDLMKWMFEQEPPPSFVHALFQLRMIIEPSAAEIAAVNRTTRQLSRMGHALEVMAESGLTNETGRAADQRFHAILLEATDNELLAALASTITAAVRWTTFYKAKAKLPMTNVIPLHQALFEAIADGNPAAARAAAVELIQQAEIETAAAGGLKPR